MIDDSDSWLGLIYPDDDDTNKGEEDNEFLNKEDSEDGPEEQDSLV